MQFFDEEMEKLYPTGFESPYLQYFLPRKIYLQKKNKVLVIILSVIL